jgi:hypothetical protein
MPLTISEARYQEIRRRVHEAERKRLLVESVPGPDAITFQTVDEFFEFLDAQTPPETQPKPPPRKRR